MFSDNTFNSTKSKMFRLDQIERICRRQLNIAKMRIFLLGRIENMVGKGENARYQFTFFFSPQRFQRQYFTVSTKVGIMW